MSNCPTCGLPTPEGNFCVRCGAPLAEGLEHSRHRGQFAVAPAERRNAPWLVSTLFPKLPRHSERHFHIALAAGAAIVIVLGALRLFGVALISAAALMPLLTLLYLYDADVYERGPRWATFATVGWGGLAGALFGVLAKALAPTGAALIDRGSTAHVITGGIVLPTLAALLMLAGPLVMLTFRRFEDVLDGATFGAATAATFAAAQAIVVGVGVLNAGLVEAGAPAPWVARLVAVAIATPVLSMCAVGAAGAAFFLRYRAPVDDRRALGPLGHPAVAVLVVVLLVVAGAIGETFMSAGAWLAWLVALDLVAIVMLRRALHIGLLEEAAEAEIGPPIRCANCGATTAAHSFCANCGISIKALPRERPPIDAVAGAVRGTFQGRLASERRGGRSGRRRLLVSALGLVVIVGAASAVAAVAATPSPRARCKPGVPCGSPPVVSRAPLAVAGYGHFTSSALGFSLRYGISDWSVAHASAAAVTLQSNDGSVLLTVSGVRRAQGAPQALIDQQLSSLRSELLGLAPDTRPSDQLLGTNVGLVPGPGGVYSATITTPQGPQAPVSVAVLAATQGGVTIAAVVTAPGDNASGKALDYEHADDVLNSIQWAAP